MTPAMDYRELLARVRNLSVVALTMGALGAELRLRISGREGDPQIRGALKAVINSFEPGQFDRLDSGQMEQIVALLRYNLKEALEMLQDPERTAGWSYSDPAMLQERGRGSGSFPLVIASLARQRPVLATLLEGERTLLDIGTGVGWLAIEAAKLWPEMRVVGTDIWEPSLALAEANIADEAVGDRVTLRRQNILELEDDGAFDLVWIPSMFLPREVCEAAMPRILRALKPSGMVILGTFSVPAGPHARAITDLLTIRSGGYPWQLDEAEKYLATIGLQNLEIVEHGAGSTSLVLGQYLS